MLAVEEKEKYDPWDYFWPTKY